MMISMIMDFGGNGQMRIVKKMVMVMVIMILMRLLVSRMMKMLVMIIMIIVVMMVVMVMVLMMIIKILFPPLSSFSSAKELPPKIEAWKHEANKFYCDKKDYTSAIRLYNQAISMCSDHAILFGNRAAAYMKRGW